MCDEQKNADQGSFRTTADEAMKLRDVGANVGVAQQGTSTREHPYDRVRRLEEQALKDERLFQTFAKLARNGILTDISVLVMEPQGIHPGSSVPIQTEYGPYNLIQLLQQYDKIRQHKNFTIRARSFE